MGSLQLLQAESEEHFRLAQSFLASAELPPGATEAQIRNTLSRSYYALFHFYNAWLVYKSVPRKKRATHRELQKSLAEQNGLAGRGEQLKLFYRGRENADYRIGVVEGPDFQGDIERYRDFARESLQEISSIFVECEPLIEQAKHELAERKRRRRRKRRKRRKRRRRSR
jgi:uncharacterized protein (UPF0332 family)